MQRIKILKSNKHGKRGDVVIIDNNEAFGLIDSGQAEITKDITPDDYKQAGELNGSTTIIRPHKFSRR